MPSSNPFPEAFLPSLPLPVGGVAPLLLLIPNNGMHPQLPPDPGGEVAAVAVAVAVDGVDGVEDHKCTRRLRGLVGEEVVVVVTILGLNLLPRLFITKLAAAVVDPQPL